MLILKFFHSLQIGANPINQQRYTEGKAIVLIAEMKEKISGFQTVEGIAIALPEVAISEFCQRWKIQEFYLFGSVLRSDFRSDSDVDVMIQFAPASACGLLELVRMKYELEELFDRKVDLLTKPSIEQSENWIRRKEILGTARLAYVAG